MPLGIAATADVKGRYYFDQMMLHRFLKSPPTSRVVACNFTAVCFTVSVAFFAWSRSVVTGIGSSTGIIGLLF